MTGHKLKVARARLGLTQAGLALKIGVARNTVTRWEMGIRRIPEPVARLVQYLLETAEQPGGSDPKKPDS